MKKIICLLSMLWTVNQLNGQSIKPAVINSAGSTNAINNISFEFSIGEFATTTISNGNIITQGVLQPLSVTGNAPLPIIALELIAKRIDANNVQLDWKISQEINNKGFYIERKKENETSFTSVAFVPSKASGGNSSLPLTYQYIDVNNYSGKTYYRLKQEDLNGTITYSKIETVQGVKGKPIKITAYPNPATTEFSVLVEKTEEQQAAARFKTQTDALQVFNISGQFIKQYPLSYNVPLKVQGLAPGIYLVKLESDASVMQKVIVQ